MTAKLHLSPDEFARLFPDQAAPTAPTITLPATVPIPDAPQPASAPPRDETTSARRTPTYDALRGILAASRAFYGAPNVTRVAGGYAIRLGDVLAVGVTITEPLTTILSFQRRDERGAWSCMDVRRMTKLAPKELLSLFVTGKELP